ncbi:hypothetical protein [Prescottella subtropica]|uniref:hypothetical protein n=1 Tax=Prescottella subtropica TaxID=2545757 RepID=UPI0010F76E7D|nr:hypothetical protein [Prescottella subtropica]
MDTGSLVDLVTSVDLGSLTDPIASMKDVVDALFKVVGDVIGLWPAGSGAANGSVDALLTGLGSAAGQ